MTYSIEYLEKYSVAPPPSRDYYGLKVLEDEVILYLWKISHGPHKVPIIYRAKFVQFNQEKVLQEEIRHAFGEYLLKYVKDIAEGHRNTFLTLPNAIIRKISTYLKLTDIVKLTSLSHITYEIFNTNSIWHILYKRNKKIKVSALEKEKAKAYGWKQLYKDRQMQTSIKGQKSSHIQSSVKHMIDLKSNKLTSSRSINCTLKPSSKTSTINIAAKKPPEFTTTDLISVPLSNTMRNARPCNLTTNMHNKKSIVQKKIIKDTNSVIAMNKNNTKKKDLVIQKPVMKQETEKLESGNWKNIKCHENTFNKQQNKPRKNLSKFNNINTNSQENKTKSIPAKMSSFSKNTVGNIKLSSNVMEDLPQKALLKMKIKPKKNVEAKSEMFKFDKPLSEDLFIVPGNDIDLADLIEASLKNIRSPRSIFDYDFSNVQPHTFKNSMQTENKFWQMDKLKQQKSTQENIRDYFSSRITRSDGILDKLSEKSESLNDICNDSFIKNKKLSLGKDNKSLLSSQKYRKTKMELKSLNQERIGDTGENFPSLSRPLKRINLLNISSKLEGRKNVSEKELSD